MDKQIVKFFMEILMSQNEWSSSLLSHAEQHPIVVKSGSI